MQNLPWGRDYQSWTTPQLHAGLAEADPVFFPRTRESIQAELRRRGGEK
jgi:hypothetical protein